jgi:hypothetical protein
MYIVFVVSLLNFIQNIKDSWKKKNFRKNMFSEDVNEFMYNLSSNLFTIKFSRISSNLFGNNFHPCALEKKLLSEINLINWKQTSHSKLL